MSSYHREVFLFLFFSLYETIDVHQTLCGHHSIMHVSQIIMLYALNLDSIVC